MARLKPRDNRRPPQKQMKESYGEDDIDSFHRSKDKLSLNTAEDVSKSDSDASELEEDPVFDIDGDGGDDTDSDADSDENEASQGVDELDTEEEEEQDARTKAREPRFD